MSFSMWQGPNGKSHTHDGFRLLCLEIVENHMSASFEIRDFCAAFMFVHFLLK